MQVPRRKKEMRLTAMLEDYREELTCKLRYHYPSDDSLIELDPAEQERINYSNEKGNIKATLDRELGQVMQRGGKD